MSATFTPGPMYARKGDTFNPKRPYGIVTEWTREECEALGDPPVAPLRTTVIAEVLAGPTAEADAKLFAAAPELLSILTRLTEKVKRANEIQHSGGKIIAEDWAELHQLTGESSAAIAKATQ